MVGPALSAVGFALLVLLANAVLTLRWHRRETARDRYFRRPIAGRSARLVLFSERGAFFNSGARERFRDATEAESERIHRFCRERLEGASYPLARFYPDVAAS